MAASVPQRTPVGGMTQDPIEDLQTRFAHQELAIEALHDTVVRQDRLISELRAELSRLALRMQELREPLVDGDTDDGELPPHY